MKSKKRILITGHKGFIGTNLIKSISDNNLILYSKDITKKLSIRDKVDCVVHLAAKTDSRESIKNPEEYYRVNILGTLNLLKLCREKNSKIIFASTGQVCGSNENKPINEETQANPVNPYTKSKLLSEELCRYYNQDFRVRCTILRFFNVYGPGQKENFLIPYIINSLIKNGKVALNNPGAIRDFIYIDDVVDSIKKAIDHNTDFDIFHIGMGVPKSIEDLVKVIQKEMGNKGQINYTLSKQEAKEIYADTTKAKNILSFNPKISLEEGISRTYNSIISQM